MVYQTKMLCWHNDFIGYDTQTETSLLEQHSKVLIRGKFDRFSTLSATLCYTENFASLHGAKIVR